MLISNQIPCNHLANEHIFSASSLDYIACKHAHTAQHTQTSRSRRFGVFVCVCVRARVRMLHIQFPAKASSLRAGGRTGRPVITLRDAFQSGWLERPSALLPPFLVHFDYIFVFTTLARFNNSVSSRRTSGPALFERLTQH